MLSIWQWGGWVPLSGRRICIWQKRLSRTLIRTGLTPSTSLSNPHHVGIGWLSPVYHKGWKFCIKWQYSQCCFHLCRQAHVWRTVSRANQLPNMVPINLCKFIQYLMGQPDHDWCNKLPSCMNKGISIGYTGEKKCVMSDNQNLAVMHSEVVIDYLISEVIIRQEVRSLGWPPFFNFVGLPVGVVITKYLLLVRYCFTHDLPWPPGDSFHDHINPKSFWCYYASFNNAVPVMKQHGVATFNAKLECTDNFNTHTDPSRRLVTSYLNLGSRATQWHHAEAVLCEPVSALWCVQLPSSAQWVH